MDILGAGGHAKVIIDILHENGQAADGVWDDQPAGDKFMDIPVIGRISDYQQSSDAEAVIAIGNNQVRKQISGHLNTVKFAAAIHPRAYVARNVNMGAGTVIMANATVNSCTVIGKHVIINTSASVDHDCHIGDFVHIAPNAALAGNVHVGEGAHVGIGASIIQNIKVGNWAMIGAGAAVTMDVPDYAVVVGVPGRIIKFNK